MARLSPSVPPPVKMMLPGSTPSAAAASSRASSIAARAARDAGDVADFSPYDLLLPEEGGDEEADDRNAEQHGDDGAGHLGPKDGKLTAAQPPRVTMRHR